MKILKNQIIFVLNSKHIFETFFDKDELFHSYCCSFYILCNRKDSPFSKMESEKSGSKHGTNV